MGKETFFIINGQELVLDKVLVEFNELPIFFVCKSNQTYFIVLCVDIENERYVVANVGLRNLAKMLHGKMTMKDFVLQAYRFWNITTGESFSEDIVIEKSVESILQDELPYEGEYLTLATKDLKSYAEEIDSMLYDEGIWEHTVLQTDDGCNGYAEFLSEPYELTMRSVYKGITKAIKRSNFVIDAVADIYDKEICNSRLEVNESDTKLEIRISNKQSWAA